MRRDRIYLAALLAAATIAAPVWAQTSTATSTGTSDTGASSSTTTSTSSSTGTGTSTTSSTGTTTGTGTGTSTTTGSFQSLSPGQQKIARALFEAQQPTATGPAPLSLDQIAALKQGTGWGQVFKQMKSEGLVGDAKNLGQVVSGHATPHGSTTTVAASTSTSTTVTTASGRPVGSGESTTSSGNATQGHGNSAHVTQAHVATSAGGAGNHGNAGSNAHAH